MKTSVLILDGDRWQREVLAAALAYEGCHAEHTGDLAVATKCLEASRFHLLLIDPANASIGGWEAARKIIECHPEVPMIVISSDEEVLWSAYLAGVPRVLVKPVDFFALLTAAEGILAARADVSENRIRRIKDRIRNGMQPRASGALPGTEERSA